MDKRKARFVRCILEIVDIGIHANVSI